jgi:beta-N-acetylhexosaminidase
MNPSFTFSTAPSNVIVCCAGLCLSAEEKALFKQMRPLGLILFARNIDKPQQVTSLIHEFKLHSGNEFALVLIDQEGGRVSRLPKSHWRIPPSPTRFSELYERSKVAATRACNINYQLIGLDLKRLGINVNCAPMLDIPQANAAAIVSHRALGSSPEQVIALADATIKGLQAAGVEPVVKHGPGHGRGTVDSHKTLPIVEASMDELLDWDFVPFTHFNQQSMLMTAHVLYTAIDANNPCTTSSTVVNEILRDCIGFNGLIMTDDIDMHALGGTTAQRAAQALAAGVDAVLQCSGNITDMRSLLSVVKPLSSHSLTRAEQAVSLAHTPCQAVDEPSLLAELSTIFDKYGIRLEHSDD